MKCFPDLNETYNILRKLSRSSYWQTIYSLSKETQGLKLFKNETDFTTLQIVFLNELAYFSSICLDVMMGDVSSVVLKEEIYQDAYSFYKKWKRDKEKDKKKPTIEAPKDNKYHKQEIVNQNQWIFTKVKGKK